MVSLSISSSRASSIHPSKSQSSLILSSIPSSPAASNDSSSSSSSGDFFDPENVTITPSQPVLKLWSDNWGRQSTDEDLRLLAASTNVTELTYSISDIQTRIFEIQELRHRSHSSDPQASGVIDLSLSQLDERVSSVSAGIKTVQETLQPFLTEVGKASTPDDGEFSERVQLLRKHSAMMAEWEALQKDIEVLREELKEDKWLTVFRTVTEQADGMMSSLEKAVNRCQEFIWQASRRDDSLSHTSSSSSLRSEKSSISLDVFNTLMDSYEAKKKHYMPATSKVLSIIDKGVQDRVTKNGECLRRHAESTQRWKNLKERIARTDIEMEAMRRLLLSLDTPSEPSSSTSNVTSKSKNGYLATPPNVSHTLEGGASLKLSRSMSPFKKLARKLTSRSPKEPPAETQRNLAPASSSEPPRTLRKRASMFHFLATPPTPVTPSHKHSHSLTPDSSPLFRRTESRAESNFGSATASRTDLSTTLNGGTLRNKPAWNSSTKVNDDERTTTVKMHSSRRPSTAGLPRYSVEGAPPLPLLVPANRSVSRSSVSSACPWSPVTSSGSSNPPFSYFRPPSRSGSQTPSGLPGASQHTRPKTPSHIPTPSLSHFRSISSGISDPGDDDDMTLMQRALSPTNRPHTPGGSVVPARPPSRSKIPIPSVHVSSASRPSSAMSNHRPDSSMSFRTSAARARTPDGLRSARPSLGQNRMPPSSFKDSPRTPGARPASRAGAATPSEALNYPNGPLHHYTPANPKDPLDAEVAAVVNSLPHGLLVERVDPPLRTIPKEGEEIRAQYSFSNQIARKNVTCKLTTLARPGTKGQTKKVMCRVGGGWQDLAVYIMSRQS